MFLKFYLLFQFVQEPPFYVLRNINQNMLETIYDWLIHHQSFHYPQ